MIIWVDAQLSPALAPWIQGQFAIDAVSVRKLGLRDSKDREIFEAAKAAHAVVLTKDADFVMLLERFGPPPKVIWIRCGNTSNLHLRELLGTIFPKAIALLEGGEHLVEITEAL